MVSLLYSLVIFLLSFTALASPIGDDSNAYRLSRGLPLKKPLIPFDATKTVAKRQQPSSAPQVGYFVVNYNDPTRRKRDGPIYLWKNPNVATFSTTTDPAQAAIFRVPGGGPYSNQEIRVLDQTSPNLKTSKIATSQSGYDVVYIARSSTESSLYKQSSAGLISYDWVAEDTTYNYTPQHYTCTFNGNVFITGAYEPSDLTYLGFADVEPITITFIRVSPPADRR
ncbi:hypothetical protein I302_106336 [Kwoniella bestiolae CBS 10118]|uniref:Alginate lyase 2 domain-containing protein n=1 Tax=Kwoniella bestiolae CBS 10118 TaxID=1296100 RepID=A0A1B9G3P5_9TREE|nr:hypothetical protein I302_05460 [Kwoniella bestiolae CBS 10118]OCF25636.1 hypothetical protein I302_05460 [Kwoniella bestiolae CBS 10118]